jgi:hypothetical protein
MELDLDKNIEKKCWQCPHLYSLDIDKTEGGGAIATTEEEGAYHPDSQM